MHESLLKFKCDAMHENWRSFKQNPTQKFCKNLINFEKPQNFSKTPKVRLKKMKCVINERRKIILEEENTLKAEDWVRKRFRVRERCLGRWRVRNNRERSRKMRKNRVEALYRKSRFSINRKVSRGVEI